MKECPGCGKQIQDSREYCAECGRKRHRESLGLAAESAAPNQTVKDQIEADKQNIKSSLREIAGSLVVLALIVGFFWWRWVAWFGPEDPEVVREREAQAALQQAQALEAERALPFEARIARTLGTSNRGVQRVSVAQLQGERLFVQWAINDNLTAGMTRGGARSDIRDMLEVIADSREPYTSVFVRGTFALADQLGNESETNVVEGDAPVAVEI